jgi:hypothetical protein
MVVVPPNPTLEDIVPLARELAHLVARDTDDVDVLVQEGLIAYHKAQRARARARHAGALAQNILYRAMRQYYKPIPAPHVPWERVRHLQAPSTQDELLELGDYFVKLELHHGARARLLAENLFAPHGACAARILAEIQRKRARQRKGYAASNPRVRYSQRLIYAALGLKNAEGQKLLTQVRAFTRAWFSHNGGGNVEAPQGRHRGVGRASHHEAARPRSA